MGNWSSELLVACCLSELFASAGLLQFANSQQATGHWTRDCMDIRNEIDQRISVVQ